MTPSHEASAPATPFDLLIRGGTVIDPTSDGPTRADVAVVDGRIAAVAPDLVGEATEVVNARNAYVVPGLVDFHVHVYWGATVWGLEADKIGAAGGTTSFLDTGSAGATTLAGMRRYVIEPARTRIRALVHICTAGLVTTLGELRDPRYLDIDGTVRAIDENRDIAPGVKIRYSENIVGEGAQARASLDAAVEAAEQAGVWLMVHIGYTPEPIPDILARLRPGDVVTHSYTPLAGGLVDLNIGGVLPAVAEARAAGIEFDIGHGKSSFGWHTARAALDSGFPPDYISSDLHRGCVHGPAFSLPNVMTKFWLLGMPLKDIVARCTRAPARKLGLDAGTLRVGAEADITVLAVDEAPVSLVDCTGEERTWDRELRAAHTFRAGMRLDPEILGPSQELPVELSSRPMTRDADA
ncbi:MAG: amidohydrolase/deacetylase family metallohydrolase [Chloroflexi bacterium]|nr:amidohydrolase/deacetylase family metallohydrolase [Chloroflexota bacterium]